MSAVRGVRTRASWSRAFATSTTHSPPGGYWQQWEREQWERDQLWEEAQARLRVERAQQAEEWMRIRQGWNESGATEWKPKERVKFWFEGGSYRAATPEQSAAWQEKFQSGGAASAQAQWAPGDRRGFYAALGLATAESRRADAATLQAAFRRTVLENHPDTAPGTDDEARTKRFRAAVAAWDVLREKTQRERYDRE